MNADSVKEGWMQEVRHLPSENFNERPHNAVVDLLVIHNISLPPEQFGGDFVDALFCNTLNCDEHSYFEQLRNLRVSAHFFINRLGEVTQYVALHQRAWHAGVSQWCGKENCNDYSVGIELEGTDNTPYTDQQYVALNTVTQKIMQSFPAITIDRIVGHCDIAPERKTDPGVAFDWKRFRESLSNACNAH